MIFSSYGMRVQLATLLLGLGLIPLAALAHQPQIVEGEQPVTVIEKPEISKAYYGELTGEPHVFTIDAREPFNFYMNVLVPDLPNAKRDVSAALINPTTPEIPIAVIGGGETTWEPFFEEFARDNYFQTPPFRAELPAGIYEIRVWSSNNDSAYSLAVGEIESFGFWDIVDAYIRIPQIKSFFFEKSAFSALFTPFIGGPLGALLILGGGFLLRRKKGI